jgi:hypothetical protein
LDGVTEFFWIPLQLLSVLSKETSVFYLISSLSSGLEILYSSYSTLLYWLSTVFLNLI